MATKYVDLKSTPVILVIVLLRFRNMAFNALMCETRNADAVYIILQAIIALQNSKTDDRLTLQGREFFRKMQFENDYGIQFAQRIMDDAIEPYPERRKVY